MATPYQCLVSRNTTASGTSEWTLFGASGSKLVVQSSRGAASIWPEQSAHIKDQEDDEFQERAGKRIKLEQPKEHTSNFSHLILSNDGQYLIGVTGEDKCVRVFQIDSQNRLLQLSERCMSRRPSSITLTSDDSTILCADKFGDVYALPLLPSPEDGKEAQPETPASEKQEQKDWLPSATALTVHSGRNRKTLEDQLKQKAKGPAKSKEPMRFKHELLLGHVSMLTDVVYTEVDGRSYIITADRDEHIRVSRGQPHAHIIEGFCFGHEAFVNKLCLTRSGLLVSGGGDDHLLVWDWQNYRLVEKLDIRAMALLHLESRAELTSSTTDPANFKVAVSGIWNIPSGSDNVDEILVACEGVPALFSFTVGKGSTVQNTLPLNGNALDVALIQTSIASSTMIVSIDNIHKPGSTTGVRDDKDVSRFQYFSMQQGSTWREDASIGEALRSFERSADATNSKSSSADDKAVRDMLYSVENLRKRPGAED
ncbi:guanine-N(7)--methyltransferase subunit TRM82 [Clathrospora elynae]|uniref:Guanine-N(7)--methyltransferase subunit TRM82 n=1 Tax=Clathrospora elynae TaxID=706981 RepID=A0A6A5SXL7_9PLEO|nr:guanine-N(7)--methyltransferase subunit TRM82 [Clathrospora elynae]